MKITTALLSTSALSALLLAAPAAYAAPSASGLDAAVEFNIPAQSLDLSLLEYSRQAGVQVISSADAVRGRAAPALHVSASPRAALGRLLQGSGLTFVAAGNTVTITALAPSRASTPAPAASRALTPAALAAPGPAAPAAPPAAASVATTGELQEVIVTAERTPSTVQKTPISISVVSDEQLQSRGITSVGALAAVEPSFSLTTGQNGAQSMTIRGVTSGGSTQFGGSAVAISTDGQYVWSNFNGILYDIDRVEILKGPQGTLYGLNSTAGAVNIITNAPRFRNSVDASVQVGNYDDQRYTATLNWKASDTLAFRLAGVRELRDGFREHPGMKASDRLDQTGIRLSGLWTPNDKLSVRLTGEYARNNIGNAAIQGVFLTPGAPGVTPGAQPTVTYKSLGLDPRAWVLDYDGYRIEQAKIVRANVTYDFGPATFTYVGSFNHTQDNHCNSPFGLATFLTHHCSARLQGTTVLPASENYNETMEHEGRFNGETSFGTKWQVGAFFSRFVLHTYVNSYRSSTAFNNDTIPANSYHQPHNSENSTALYGQITQAVSSKLSLTGGLRYSHISQVAKDNWTDTLNNTLLRSSGGRTIQYNRVFNDDSSKYNKVTWRAGIDYQATPNSLIYGSVSTSFKDGGFTQYNDFAPELITAYEVGTKNRFLNNTVQVNAAAYWYDYTNQQARVFRDFPDGAHITTVNAGASTIKGVEVTGLWMPTRNDTLNASVNYQDGEYTDFPILLTVIPKNGSSDLAADLAGNRPPNLSHWILTAGWEHTWARWGDMSLSTSVNTRYLSGYFLSVSNLPGDHQKGFLQSDASITLTGIKDHWDLTAWVRNIENNDTLNFGQFVVSTNPIYQFGWNPPRTFGVRLNAHF